MARRTIYTSTITVPVYAGWKCRKCQTNNFSQGIISYRRQASSSSLSRSKQKEAEEKASELANELWMSNAFNIIMYPCQNPVEVRNYLFIPNTKCKQCGKKPEWDKNMSYLGIFGLAFFAALIDGFIALILKTNIIAWIIFGIAMSGVLYACYTEPHYKHTMKNLPEQYIPVLGSYNEDLKEYAKQNRVLLPTPEDVQEMVNKGIHFREIRKENAPFGYCRKCGAPLVLEEGFCNKCGEKIVYFP